MTGPCGFVCSSYIRSCIRCLGGSTGPATTMPTRPFAHKNGIFILKGWLQYRTLVSITNGGRYYDALEDKVRDTAEGQEKEGGEPTEPEEVNGRLKKDDGRGYMVERDGEGWIMRSQDWVMRTGGYCEIMLGRTKEGDGKVRDGVVCFLIKGRWRQVPHKHWAWKPQPRRTTYLRCGYPSCEDRNECLHVYKYLRDYDFTDWIPEVTL